MPDDATESNIQYSCKQDYATCLNPSPPPSALHTSSYSIFEVFVMPVAIKN